MPVEKPTAKDVFWKALEFSAPADREIFVKRACQGDIELRLRVEKLLAALSHSDSFLNSPVAKAFDPQPLVTKPGTPIGPYVIREQIGEGGMGEVFVAEQTEPVRRKVALKIIRPGMATKDVIARFEAERQALAMMDHPNIAHVFDGGTTEAGQPYFVMELVQGLPITEYFDARRLTTRRRLELFVKVCRAVQHAHQKGIIHRDLKPSNVLVAEIDGSPVSKVIDFGVAKAIGQKLTEKTVYTQFTQMIGTPTYMSPEQAALGVVDVDTRSDIYSLGVLLYELLTGTTPFDGETLKQASFEQMQRILREQEPRRPSAQVSTLSAQAITTIAQRRDTDPRKLRDALHGDLDWIVLRCLEKDRGRRYQTVSALEEDLRRYFAGDPVLAQPPSQAYLVRKFVQRNRGPVLSALAVLLALVGGVIGTTWGMILAQEARNAAISAQHAEAQRAEGERRAKEEAQKRLAQIETGTQALASMIQDLDPLVAEREGVTLRALLGRRLGEAAEQFDGEAVGDPLVVARLQHVLGISLHELGYLKQAEAVLIKACRTRERLLGTDDLNTVTTRHQLAMLYRDLAKYDLAEKLYEEALASRTAKLGPDHPDTLTSRHHLGMLYHSQGEYDLAEAMIKEVIDLRTARLGADHPDTLTSQHRLAWLYRSQRKYDLAETLCREVLVRRITRLGGDHLDTLASKHLLAVLYVSQGKSELAEPLYKEVLQVRIAKLGADHPDTITSQHYLAVLYSSMDKLDRSISLLEETLALRKAKLGADHPTTLMTQVDLGVNYCFAGRLADGITLLEQVHQKDRKDRRLLRAGSTLLSAYFQAGKTTEATALAAELLQAARDELPADSLPHFAALADVGWACLDWRAYVQAEPLLRESLSRGEQYFPDVWRTHHAKLLLGIALLGQRKFAEAEPLLLAGYSATRQRQAQISPESTFPLTQAVAWIAELYEASGQPDKAAEWRGRLPALTTAQ